eukprot:scaffold88663_cov40-Prasinocladus_malaysianus.AAC.2
MGLQNSARAFRGLRSSLSALQSVTCVCCQALLLGVERTAAEPATTSHTREAHSGGVGYRGREAGKPRKKSREQQASQK